VLEADQREAEQIDERDADLELQGASRYAAMIAETPPSIGKT